METRNYFGFVSGLATVSSHLFPTIAIATAIFINWEPQFPTIFFASLAIVVKITGDWLFWSKMFPSNLDSNSELEGWRSSVKDILISQPDAIRSITSMLLDLAADVTIVCMTLKASVPAAWVFLAYLGCHAIAEPIQGIAADRLDRTSYGYFSMILTALAVLTALGINTVFTSGTIFARMFELKAFAPSTQLLLVFCVKSLLSGTSIIGKATVADCIYAGVEKKYLRG